MRSDNKTLPCQQERGNGMHRLAVCAVGAAAFVLAASVPEGAHADSTHERTEEAISRVANGDWTKDDLTLIKSQPEVAGRVPDPSRKPDVVARSAPVPTGATATLSAAVSTCKAYWVNYSYYSLLGSKIYTWQKYVSLCYNGSVVTSVNERYDWLPYRQSMVIVRERTIDEQSGKGTWQYSTRIERHLEYCVAKYGCYADTYPWGQMKINGNGQWTYSGADS